MANTYTQIYIHIVFAVEGRQNIIPKRHKEELHKYITGIIQNKNQKLIAINCMPDHVHILIGMNSSIALSDLVRDIKSSSSKFINEKRWIAGRFNWQEGYGAFSYSRSQLDAVIRYITNQEEHHSNKTFRDEYIDFLKKFDVDYDAKYLFNFIDDKT
jgi:putative transposase